MIIQNIHTQQSLTRIFSYIDLIFFNSFLGLVGILPFQQTRDPGLAHGHRTEDQRAVADRLVARHADAATQWALRQEVARGGWVGQGATFMEIGANARGF